MRRLLAVSALVLIAACDLPSGDLPPMVRVYGGQVHVVAATRNTVSLVVLGRDGTPAQADVRLALDTSALRAGMLLAASLSDPGRDTLTVTSNALGLVSMVITSGSRAGRAVIYVQAPSLALDDSLVFDFPAGAVQSLDLDPITPMLVGDSTVLTWTAYDSSYQHVYATVGLNVADPAVASLVDGDVLKAMTTGYTWVRLQAAGVAADSSPLAVVPPGTLGAIVRGDWYEFPTTGVPPTLVFSPRDFSTPAYSPSRDTLAFVHNSHITLRLPTGDTVAPLANLGFSERDPAWSPDGQWLYFTAVYADGRHQIWRAHPDGSSAALVGPATALPYRDDEPTVNAAGQLAYTTGLANTGAPGLRVITVATGATVFTGPVAQAPKYSPDGASIAFLAGGQLHVIGADGTNDRTLTPSMTAYLGPLSWSNDSRWIAVAHGSVTGGTVYLYLVDTVNDTPIRLPYAFLWTSPAWK